MDYFHAEYLVVLGPAIAIALVGFFVEGLPRITTGYGHVRLWFAKVLSEEQHVHTMKEFVVHAAFLGPAVGLIVGIDTKSREAYFLAAAFFLGALLGSIKLSKLLTQIAAREAKDRHRRMAGTVRSIVRSELARDASSEVENNGGLKATSDEPTMTGTGTS